ncbi:MAG: DUF4124 domain-containing protein [Gammaproteobacteria bacterium]|nr:DUF4124 domain-containing protein [Gammaproteobacteria bacterium]
MNRFGLSVPVLFFVLGCLALTAHAATYRWVDAEGHVHFGDAPPIGVKAVPLQLYKPSAPLSPAQAQEQIQRLRAVEAAKAATTNAEQATAAANAKAKLEASAALRARCDRARWALAALDSGRPVYRDEQGAYRVKRPPPQGDAYTGKRAYLDGTTRTQEIAKYRRELTVDCAAFPEANDQRRADDELRMAEHCEAAYAELKALTRPEARASSEEIASRQAFIANNCGPSASH